MSGRADRRPEVCDGKLTWHSCVERAEVRQEIGSGDCCSVLCCHGGHEYKDIPTQRTSIVKIVFQLPFEEIGRQSGPTSSVADK